MSQPKLKPLSMAGRHFGLPRLDEPKPAKTTTKGTKHPKNASVVVISDSDSDDMPELVSNNTRSQEKGKSRQLQSEAEAQTYVETDLWSEHFCPETLEDLAVHKKKVADVRGWLNEAIHNPKLAKYRKLLVLSGPAGAGKTATIRMICKELNVDIMEFRSGLEGGADSLTTQFQAFLSSCVQRPALAFAGAGPSTSKTSLPEKDSRRLILVEDLPNIFTSQQTRNSFRGALSDFVAQSPSQRSTSVPMVLIVTETVVRSGQDENWQGSDWSTTQDEGISVRSLVPLDVLKGGRCTEIRFNPVALTIQVKGLNRVLGKAAERALATQSTFHKPTDAVVKAIAQSSNGDLRSAINTLQFLASRTSSTTIMYDDVQVPSKGKKRKRAVGKATLGQAQEDALTALVTGRESSLFLFHALGRVLYSKRWGESLEDDSKDTRTRPPSPMALPEHLRPQYNRLPSKVDANELFADAPVDTDLFTAYLHQNYTGYMEDIDQCADALDYLSSADSLLRLEGATFARHPATSQYSFQTSVRGMLMSLPSPVPRRGQKMYKAELWECNRKLRENEQAVASLAIVFSRSHRPLRALDQSDCDYSMASMQLASPKLLSREIVPFLKLFNLSGFGALPPFAMSLIRELSNLTPMEMISNTGSVLGEHDPGNDEEALSLSPPGLAEAEADAEEQSQPEQSGEWYIGEDDIEDSD